MAHIYTRLVGHGIAVYPSPGLALQRDADEPSTLQIYLGEDAEPVSLLPENVKAQLQGDEVMEACEGVEVQLAASESQWQVETSPFSCPWPEGFALVIPDPPGEPSFFDLVAAEGSSVWIQGPFETAGLPTPGELATEGQELSLSGQDGEVDFAELIYRHEGADWIQRYLFVEAGEGTLIVTAQGPVSHLHDLRQIMAELSGQITCS